MDDSVDSGIGVVAAMASGSAVQVLTHHAHHYELVCRGADGKIKWNDCIDNLIVNTGLNELLTQFWKGSGYTAAFFVGLTSGTPTVSAADTMASHAGWTDVTTYSQGSRPALTLGSVASQSVSNSASPAEFSISGSATIGGAFVTTNATKGGTTGILIGAGALLGGNKVLDNGDTLSITITATAAAA